VICAFHPVHTLEHHFVSRLLNDTFNTVQTTKVYLAGPVTLSEEGGYKSNNGTAD